MDLGRPLVPIVILAAGASRRLGTAKQLVRFEGQTLLGRAVATARAVDCNPVLVVLGAGIATLQPEVAGPGVRVVENVEWATGMASSVRAALAVVAADYPEASALLFTVCDQPLVTPALLATITAAYQAGHDLVAAAYGGSVGVPALLDRRYFGELTELTGDSGARRILSRHRNVVFEVPFPDGIVDVDTPADAESLAARNGA